MSPTKHPEPRPSLRRAAAFFAVALVAALAVHGVYYFRVLRHDDAAGASSTGEAVDPALVLQDLRADLDDIEARAAPDVDGLVAEARARADEAAMQAEVQVTSAADALRGGVGEAAAATDGLPLAPDGYLPGAPVTSYLPPVAVPAYATEGFGTGGLDALDALRAQWAAAASEIVPPDSVLPSEVQEVGETAGSTAGGAMDDPLMQPLWILTAGTGAREAVDGALSGSSGAEGAIEPDEAGAQLARDHAQDLLARGDGLLDYLQAHLELVEMHQEGIVSIVEEELAATQEAATEQEAALREELESRLAAAVDAVPATQAQVDGAVDGYVATLQQTQTDAEATLGSVTGAGTTGLLATGEDAAATLRSRADAAVAEAEALAAEARTRTDAAVFQLQVLREEHGLDTAVAVEDARAMGDQAVADIRATAERSAAALQAEAARIETTVAGEAARLQTLAAEAQAEANAVVGDAVALAESARAFGHAAAAELSALAAEAEMAAASEAVDALHASAEEHADAIIEKALDLNAEASAAAERAAELAAAVHGDAGTFVDEDLAYILAVAEDYAARGPADVDGKAEEWLGIHTGLSEVQDEVELLGWETKTQAELLADALEDIRVDLLAAAPVA